MSPSYTSAVIIVFIVCRMDNNFYSFLLSLIPAKNERDSSFVVLEQLQRLVTKTKVIFALLTRFLQKIGLCLQTVIISIVLAKFPKLSLSETCLSQTESLYCSRSAKSLFNNWLVKESLNLIILDRFADCRMQSVRRCYT